VEESYACFTRYRCHWISDADGVSQYLYPKYHFGAGSDPKWHLARLYQPFWSEKFYEMAFSLNLLEKRDRFEDSFSNTCIQKTILE